MQNACWNALRTAQQTFPAALQKQWAKHIAHQEKLAEGARQALSTMEGIHNRLPALLRVPLGLPFHVLVQRPLQRHMQAMQTPLEPPASILLGVGLGLHGRVGYFHQGPQGPLEFLPMAHGHDYERVASLLKNLQPQAEQLWKEMSAFYGEGDLLGPMVGYGIKLTPHALMMIIRWQNPNGGNIFHHTISLPLTEEAREALKPRLVA